MTEKKFCSVEQKFSIPNGCKYSQPTPAFPENNKCMTEVSTLPSVEFLFQNNYGLFDKLNKETQTKLETFWKIFRELPNSERKVALDGLFSLCSWPQLPYSFSLLTPLLRVDFLTTLPGDISWKILSYLDAKSLCQASQVCKRWKEIAEDENIWKRMCDTHTGQKCGGCGWGLPRLNDSCPNSTNPAKRLKRTNKDIFAERLIVARNWKKGAYQTKTLIGHTDGVMCAQICGNKLVSGSYDRDIRIWDISTGECVGVLQGHTRCVRCIQFDEEKVISGSMDATIRIWCLKTRQCLRTLNGHSEGILCLAYDNKRLVSGSVDCEIKVWDIRSSECYTLNGHTDWVNSVTLHNEDFLISGSDDLTIRYWDLRTKQCIKVFEGHVGQIQCLQARGNKLVSGSLDNTIKIWDIEKGTCIKTLFGHMEGVWCVKFDSLRLVSGAHDKTLKIWDLDTGACVETFTQPDVINCLQLSESRIVTGSNDAKIRILDFGRQL